MENKRNMGENKQWTLLIVVDSVSNVAWKQVLAGSDEWISVACMPGIRSWIGQGDGIRASGTNHHGMRSPWWDKGLKGREGIATL